MEELNNILLLLLLLWKSTIRLTLKNWTNLLFQVIYEFVCIIPFHLHK